MEQVSQGSSEPLGPCSMGHLDASHRDVPLPQHSPPSPLVFCSALAPTPGPVPALYKESEDVLTANGQAISLRRHPLHSSRPSTRQPGCHPTHWSPPSTRPGREVAGEGAAGEGTKSGSPEEQSSTCESGHTLPAASLLLCVTSWLTLARGDPGCP